MKKSAILLAAMLFGFSTASAHADSLKGSTVRAALVFSGGLVSVNLFPDPLDKIGSGKEFAYDDLIATYTANFNATGFTIRVKCDDGITLRKCEQEPGFIMVFKDNLFVNATVTYDSGILNALYLPFNPLDPSDPFNPKIFSVVEVAPISSRNENLVFTLIPAPEPSSVVLFATGLLSLAGPARRRFVA